MSRHFSGSLVAAVVVLLLIVMRYSMIDEEELSGPEVIDQAPLISFEKSELVGIHIKRSDLTVSLHLVEGEWEMEDYPWRANRTMARRVAHQIHDLTARALVTLNAEDLSLYGLGEDAIVVRLTLKEGEEKAFRVGDPNPTSVSYYVQPLPGRAVYTVQKAAMDYYREELTAFREPKFAWFHADDANRISFASDDMAMSYVRVGPKSWRMTEPVVQNADRERVRQMLGRTGALKALAYVADEVTPEQLSQYGLSDPHAEVRVGLSSGETLSLLISKPMENEGQIVANVYRVEDRAVYQAKVGFLDAFDGDTSDFRDPVVLRGQAVVSEVAFRDEAGNAIRMTRGVDGWQWGDKTPIPGSTPRRLAASIRALRAEAFHDLQSANVSFSPVMTLELLMESGEGHRLSIGPSFEVPSPEMGTQLRRLVSVEGEHTEYEVTNEMWNVLEDVQREHARHRARLKDRDLQSALTPNTP
jgi:hypothetical protein